MRIEILLTGDEVMNGTIEEVNAAWLSRELFARGLPPARTTAVGDDREEIARALIEIGGRADAVVVSGGLGPTADDVTMEAAALAVGSRLALDARSLDRMREMFALLGRSFSPTNEKQAMIPEGARAIDNPLGTAPGVRLSIGGAQAFFFAGVPREFRALCRGELFGFLDERAGGAPPPRCRVIKTLGMAESAIAHSLRGLEQAFPDVRVGYRPVFPENHLRLYAAGERAAERVLEAEQEIRRRLGETVIFGVDGEEFAWAVGQALRTAGLTLATAESCTGGLAASMITAVPGSSDYFVGGCVAYSNGLKERLLGVSRWTLDRHGAVSREAVLEMASGARERMGAGLAVSVSGVAGPGGGTAEKPVGLVHFALAGPAGAHAIARRFPGDRAMVQRAAAYTALELVRREALGLPRARPE